MPDPVADRARFPSQRRHSQNEKARKEREKEEDRYQNRHSSYSGRNDYQDSGTVRRVQSSRSADI